jgi:hypothetical protein
MLTNEQVETGLNEVWQRVQFGTLMDAKRADLERFGTLLARSQAFAKFGDREYPQICEFVRLLLLVRLSEESERRALEVANVSLRIAQASKAIAWAALGIGTALGVAQIVIAFVH